MYSPLWKAAEIEVGVMQYMLREISEPTFKIHRDQKTRLHFPLMKYRHVAADVDMQSHVN